MSKKVEVWFSFAVILDMEGDKDDIHTDEEVSELCEKARPVLLEKIKNNPIGDNIGDIYLVEEL